MLHFQVGTFKGISDDGFLIMEMNGPPQPVAAQHELGEQEEESHGLDPVSVLDSTKRKADISENRSAMAKSQKQEHILPTDSKSIVYMTDGTTEEVNGPFSTSKLQRLINCKYLQMVPCTVGDLNGKYGLWMNQSRRGDDEFNEKATEIFGNQVFEKKLYGNVLVVPFQVVD